MEMNQFIRDFENAIFGINSGRLTPETWFRKVTEWESIASLCLLSMIDTEYNVQIGEMELKQCCTLRDVFELVLSKKLLRIV